MIRPTKPIVPTDETSVPTMSAEMVRYAHLHRLVLRPSVVAASSPIKSTLRERNCVKKNTLTRSTTTTETPTFPQLARAKEPMVQNFKSIMPSALAAIVIMKLERAVNRAFKIMPERTSFDDVICPPVDASNKTPIVAIVEPINENSGTEEIPTTCTAPAPSMMAQVAPHEAPDEMPKIYGSAKVF